MKIHVIIRSEYLRRIKKKSFLVLTLLLPLLIIGIIAMPLYLSRIKNTEKQNIALCDHTNTYANALQQADSSLIFVSVREISPNLLEKPYPYDAALEIKQEKADTPPQATLYSIEEIQPQLLKTLTQALTQEYHKKIIQNSNIPKLQQTLDALAKNSSIRTVKYSKDGEQKQSNNDLAMALAIISTLLIYVFVLSYGTMVMQSVAEEKTSRIVEIIISSVHPFELMMGKILAIMALGLTQISLWGLCLVLCLTMGLNIAGMDMSIIQDSLHGLEALPLGEMSLMFMLMFLGGYLLYASFYAAVGASINEQQDAAQYITPLTLIMVFALYAALYSVENTNGPLAYWGSLFPLTSPIVMMTRIPFGVPLWQEVLSVVLLYGSAIAMVFLGAKIYRVGILMYGKKPTPRELLRWLRY